MDAKVVSIEGLFVPHYNKSMEQLRKEISNFQTHQAELQQQLDALPDQETQEAHDLQMRIFIIEDNDIEPRQEVLSVMEYQAGIA